MYKFIAISSFAWISFGALGQDRGLGNELGPISIESPSQASSTGVRWAGGPALTDARDLAAGLNSGGAGSGASGGGSASSAAAAELGVNTRQEVQGGKSLDAQYWFLRAGLGPSFAQDSRVTINFAQPENQIRFEPGVRLDVAAGYQFTPWFGLEGQLAVTSNSLRSIEGSPDTHGDFEQYAHMVNAVFKLPNKSGFEPYLGVGLGVSLEVLNIQTGAIQGTPLHGYDGAASLAFEFMAGFRFRLSDRWSLAVEYEYLSMTRPEFDLAEFTPSRTSGTLVLRNPRNHSLTGSFVFKF